MKYPKVEVDQRQKISKTQARTMKKLRSAGMPVKKIAKKFNVDISTVYRYTSETYDREAHNRRTTENNTKRYHNDIC